MSWMLFVLAQVAAAAEPSPPPPAPVEAAPAAAEEFQIGKATISEVVAKLGKPMTRMAQSDGTQIMVWVQSKMKVKGTSFIPVIGMFASGAKTASKVDTYTFDAKGVLAAASHIDTSLTCNGGIAGGGCR